MEQKVIIMDADAQKRTLTRIAHQIVESVCETKNLCLVGIKTRGVPMAKCLAEQIELISGERIPVGVIDIAFYRDDLVQNSLEPKVQTPEFSFDVNGKTVVLVDDVIYTGRTARAAMDAVFSAGRASRIALAVLVDRGHRELPIRPDFVGKNVPTSNQEMIQVQFEETDGKTGVVLCSIR